MSEEYEGIRYELIQDDNWNNINLNWEDVKEVLKLIPDSEYKPKEVCMSTIEILIYRKLGFKPCEGDYCYQWLKPPFTKCQDCIDEEGELDYAG